VAPSTQHPNALNALALAYRAGEADALPRIFESLRWLAMYHVDRYHPAGRPLPAILDHDDLVQQAWLILDGLLHQWDPAVGDFGAYARVAFPKQLLRYVRMHSPRRRARDVRVDNVDHDDIVERCNEIPGADGRRWDDQLILAELIDDLDPRPRQALLLRVLEDRPPEQVARTLRISEPVMYRESGRALRDLRRRLGGVDDPADDPPARPETELAIQRLVVALHAGADPDGLLPGRAWIAERTGLSTVRMTRLIRLLVQRGCVEGRSRRRPGRLVHRTPAATLRRALAPPAPAPAASA
jgi:RNA polymerase sigma factor (sigma-70 family)